LSGRISCKDNEEREVSKMLDLRNLEGQLEYRVEWVVSRRYSVYEYGIIELPFPTG
jgi:hypothetical protein